MQRVQEAPRDTMRWFTPRFACAQRDAALQAFSPLMPPPSWAHQVAMQRLHIVLDQCVVKQSFCGGGWRVGLSQSVSL